MNNGVSCDNKHTLSRKLKAVIGYWTDYFIYKTDSSVTFAINNNRITISEAGDERYVVYFKWIRFDVYYTNIFQTLNLLEKMLKGLDDNVAQS